MKNSPEYPPSTLSSYCFITDALFPRPWWCFYHYYCLSFSYHICPQIYCDFFITALSHLPPALSSSGEITLGGKPSHRACLLFSNLSFLPRSFRRLYSLMLTLISFTARTALVKGTLSGWDSGVEFSNSISSSG